MNIDIGEIQGALARGYCTKENKHKEMDITLCVAQGEEIQALLAPDWKDIKEAPKTGHDVWLGWKPFEDGSGVVPRLGCYDIGSKQWISHWEDHGDEDGHRPISFTPQPDYYCEAFIPPHPKD
jgi:hypothetical protein